MNRTKPAYRSYLADVIGTFAFVPAGTGAVAGAFVAVLAYRSFYGDTRSRLFLPARSKRDSSINE